ncbi:MAG: amino acid permease [Acidimicrobiales bacterium]
MDESMDTGAAADTIDIGADLPLQVFEPPEPIPAALGVPLPPDSFGYRFKRRFLGEPLHSDEMEHQRLGKPTALAVFASDNLSSSAYATEEILHVLVPAIGLAAFSLVVPITLAMVVVLGFLILSYRETIKEYPSAGGAYLVTRDNFGIVPAQVAGASLLTDYILTVAVSASAGTAALVSAIEGLVPYKVPIALFFICLIAYGNLRGVKESGKVFAVPTYFFMVNMAVLLGLGFWKFTTGDLPVVGEFVEGNIHHGSPGDGLLMGAGLYVVLHAFASGGAAVTGVEAISNGVPAFKEPSWRNARQTLVLMGVGLGIMFLGLSALAARIKVSPFEGGTPTVISQIGEAVYGKGALGTALYFSLQTGTMLILVMAANTGFADFPRLASFQAGDSFLPRQMTKRGHRLVYSNGVLVLAGAAILLVIVTRAEVTALIPLYAIGVFTGFTLSQAGMTKHHIRRKEAGWRKGVVINGFGAFVSFVVALIIAITKFADGAWVILILLPLMVVVLLRLNNQYQREAQELDSDVPAAIKAPILRRHVVLVFVDRLDMASARAIQYARSLTPDDLRVVHFAVDDLVATDLAEEWRRLGLTRVPLDIVGCPDRRLTRAAVQHVARELADGETEVSVLLPDRKYRGLWHRVLHDRTAEAFLADLSRLPHANVTTVPFQLDSPTGSDRVADRAAMAAALTTEGPSAVELNPSPRRDLATLTPIVDARWRDQVRVAGEVRSLRVVSQHDSPTLELVVTDDSGALSIVFLGRREIAGIGVGTRLEASGTVGVFHNRLAMLNPSYELRPRES